MQKLDRTQLLGSAVSLLGEGEDFVEIFCQHNPRQQTALFCNVHMVMLARKDPELAQAMAQADFVLADGVPVAWLQGKLTGRKAAVMRGYQVMLSLCRLAAQEGSAVGLYGATDQLLEQLEHRLLDRFPGLKVGYRHAPPYLEGEIRESEAELERINDSDIRFLFVALGCPKQEKWLAHHKNQLECSILAVGAAFGWLAGVEPMVPRWMERMGLGWLHRWLHHPFMHFRRYAYNNPKFITLAMLELLRARRRR